MLTFILITVIFLFIFRYIMSIHEPISRIKETIIFLNKEYTRGNYAVQASDIPKFYDTREDSFILFQKYLIHKEYREQVAEYENLKTRKLVFWKLVGKIYASFLLLCIALYLLSKLFQCFVFVNLLILPRMIC